jgi:hypothetical protein
MKRVRSTFWPSRSTHSKSAQLQGRLNALVPEGTENLAQRVERAELVTVGYDKFSAITSRVAGAGTGRCRPAQHFRSGGPAD